jgi:DNA-binding GntR family transcriptional regulator
MADLLRDSVYRAIRAAILSCELQPGQELREQTLAEKYHVSRSPVRDSLLRLEQERLVTVLPRQGYRVNPIEIRDVEELFGLRLLISPACAAEAAQADGEALRALDQFRSRSEGELNADLYIDYNRAFYVAVAHLVANSRLSAVEIALIEEFNRIILIVLGAFHDAIIPVMMAEHDAIIDSIQSHDSDNASRRVHDHLVSDRGRVLRAWERIDGRFAASDAVSASG